MESECGGEELLLVSWRVRLCVDITHLTLGASVIASLEE